MKGKDLKYAVKNSEVKAIELIEKSGIPQKTFYRLFEKDEVEPHYIDKLKSAGLKLHESVNNDIEIECLRQQISALKAQVETLTGVIKSFEITNETLNFLLVKQAPENPLAVAKLKAK